MPTYKVTNINWNTTNLNPDEIRGLPGEMTIFEAPNTDCLADTIHEEVGTPVWSFCWEEVPPVTRESYEEAVRDAVASLAILVPPADMTGAEMVKIMRSVLKEYGVL